MKPITLTLTKPHTNNYNACANYPFIQLIIQPILWNHERMPVLLYTLEIYTVTKTDKIPFRLQDGILAVSIYRNQIDCILCSQRWKGSIQSAKVRLGAGCGSDHELLIAKFRLKLKKVGKPPGHSGMT